MLLKHSFIEIFLSGFREKSPGACLLSKSDWSVEKKSHGDFNATVPLVLHATLWTEAHTSLTENPQNLSSWNLHPYNSPAVIVNRSQIKVKMCVPNTY